MISSPQKDKAEKSNKVKLMIKKETMLHFSFCFSYTKQSMFIYLIYSVRVQADLIKKKKQIKQK